MAEDAVTGIRAKISEFILECKNFSDSHRFAIQCLIRKGCITKKQFYLTYLRYHVTVTLQQDVKCIASCEASETEVDELVKSLVKVCNQKCQQIGFRVKLITKESDEKQFVVICSDRPFSNAMLAASGWKEDDHVCITSFIKYALKNEGKIERTWAREFSRNLPNPMLAKQVEHLLNVMVKQKWFYWSECKTFLEMDVRLIAELEPLLRFQYNIPHCIFCNSATIDLRHATACSGCDRKFHQRCFRKLLEASNGSINCLECDKLLTSEVLSEDYRVMLRYFRPNDENPADNGAASQAQTGSEEEPAEVSQQVKARTRRGKRAAHSSDSDHDRSNMTADELSQLSVEENVTSRRSTTRRSSKLVSRADKPDKNKVRRKERSSDKIVARTDTDIEDEDGEE